MTNRVIQALRDQLLSTVSGSATSVTSAPIPFYGNRASLALLVINGNASSFSCQMQGSYDGVSWFDVGSALTQASFGYDDTQQGSIDYQFVRVVATISGTADKNIIFDATIAMSDQ